MYDYGLSVLEQYGLNALSSGRVRGALLCRTERGPVILREFHGSEKKLSMQQKLLQKLKEQGCHVDVYLENREGALVSKDKDSIPYTAQVWFEGRECDTKSETDILKSVRMLAEIHGRMQLPLEKDYTARNLKEVWNGFWKKEKRRFPCWMKRIIRHCGSNLLKKVLSVMESIISIMC